MAGGRDRLRGNKGCRNILGVRQEHKIRKELDQGTQKDGVGEGGKIERHTKQEIDRHTKQEIERHTRQEIERHTKQEGK